MTEPKSEFKNNITISLLSCAVVMIIFYLYSRATTPDGNVFLSQSLYNFAIVVLISFFGCMSFIIFGTLKALFSKGDLETNSLRLIPYFQTPFRERKFMLVFALSSIVYFIFFGFLTNMFILFNDDGTVLSLIPSFNNLGSPNHNLDGHSASTHNSESFNSIEALQKGGSDLHAAHPQHQSSVFEDEFQTQTQELESNNMNYPGYRIIICCNNFGYVPMLTILINGNFSFLLIPLNFFLGIIISLLVGLNISLSVFVLKRLRLGIKSLSKGNVLGSLGLSTGLLVGCPTCAGSLLYSIAGFSSIIAFSSLSLYQIFFVVISIPFLILSLIIMTKLLRTSICDIHSG